MKMAIITHYTRLAVLLNHLLPESTFMTNPLSKVNDPFEYTKRTPTATDIRDFDQRFKDAMAIVTDVLPDKIKVGSFAVDKGDENNFRTWTSILNAPLWAHYGENSSGVAIVFDEQLFLEACRNTVNYQWALHAAPMTYLDSASHLEKPNQVRLNEVADTQYLTIAKYMFERATHFWFTKSHLWTHENEFRVMLFNEEAGPTMVDIKKSIKAVVFGEKVSDVVLNAIGDYLHRQGIAVLSLNYDEVNECHQVINVFP